MIVQTPQKKIKVSRFILGNTARQPRKKNPKKKREDLQEEGTLLNGLDVKGLHGKVPKNQMRDKLKLLEELVPKQVSNRKMPGREHSRDRLKKGMSNCNYI